MIEITLPWPPSVNHYWRRCKDRYFISAEGKNYRETVNYLSLKARDKFSVEDRLEMIIQAYPPDKRRRDLDNVLKSLLDSLQHAGVYSDDSQIDSLSIERKLPLRGEVVVTIQSLTTESHHPQNLLWSLFL